MVTYGGTLDESEINIFYTNFSPGRSLIGMFVWKQLAIF